MPLGLAAVRGAVLQVFDDAEWGFRAILDKAPHDRQACYLLEQTMIMRIEFGGITPLRDWRSVHVHRAKM